MQFYILERAPKDHHESARTDAELVAGFNTGSAPRCPECGKYVGMLSWLPPFRVKLHTWGAEYGDFAFLNVGSDILISEKCIPIFDESRLNGLSSFAPVDVISVHHHASLAGRVPTYYKATVLRSCTAVDQVKSGFEWRRPPSCHQCRLGDDLRRWNEVVIDEGTWSGEDIFIARGLPGLYVTSSRFKDVCETYGLLNAVFVPSNAYARDFYSCER
jgi:hypothetical protein